MVLMTSFQLVQNFQKIRYWCREYLGIGLLQMIEQYPSLLRRPIITDTKRMQIGFNEDEIRFLLVVTVNKN